MTIRKAIIFYLSTVIVLLAAGWGVALWYDWRAGMIVMTVVLLEHVWRVVKSIRQNRI